MECIVKAIAQGYRCIEAIPILDTSNIPFNGQVRFANEARMQTRDVCMPAHDGKFHS